MPILRGFRFSLGQMFRLQFTLAPLCLAIPYAYYLTHPHPLTLLTAFAWLAAPPIFYAGVLTWLRLGSKSSESSVFSGVATGARYGLLFGAVAWGASLLSAAFSVAGFLGEFVGKCLNWGPPPPTAIPVDSLLRDLGEPVFVFGFFLVHYSVFGAFAGALAGVIYGATQPRGETGGSAT